MADNFRFAQLQNFSLEGAGAVSGATSIILQSFTDIDGNLVTMDAFGQIGFGTMEPGNGSLEEQICFTGVTQNANGTATLTGISSVTFLYPYTQMSGLAKTHAGSTTFVISNTSGFYDKFVAKDDDGTISETLTFTTPNFPQMSDDTTMPTEQAQLVTKAYADSLAIAGAPDASTSIQGLVQLATQAQVDAKTATGSTGAALEITPDKVRSTLLSDYVVDTGSANAYAIAPSPAISAYAVGQIFSFEAANSNSGASTLNVNGVGTKNILKLNGATALASGDINVGQIIIVEYDGTEFQMLNPVANAPLTSSTLKFGGTGSDGSLSITSGTTTISASSAKNLVKNYTSISITSTGELAFSTPSSSGTIIVLKSIGNITLTSSATPLMNVSSMGASGGSAGSNGNSGVSSISFSPNGKVGGNSAGNGQNGTDGTVTLLNFIGSGSIVGKIIPLFSGAGGGGGGSDNNSEVGGAGGIGGGALYIECGGSLDFTGVVYANGSVGSNGNSSGQGGGGGGGGGGTIIILYNSQTAVSGTFSVSGGSGGAKGVGSANGYGGGGSGGSSGSAVGSAGSSGVGGSGGAGYSVIQINNDFV